MTTAVPHSITARPQEGYDQRYNLNFWELWPLFSSNETICSTKVCTLESRQVRTGMDGHGSVTMSVTSTASWQVGALCPISTAIYFALLKGLGTLLRLLAKCGAASWHAPKLTACMGR